MKRRRTHLLLLPYDILHSILSLVLPDLPSTVYLTVYETPFWLKLFSSSAWSSKLTNAIPCPAILQVCKRLTRHALRILYAHTRITVPADRDFLVQLSSLSHRKYVQHIDLALELRLRSKPVLKSKQRSPLSPIPDATRRLFPENRNNRPFRPGLRSLFTTFSDDNDNIPDGQWTLDAQYSIAPPHDILCFYSPAYLVDLLHRIFPRLKSINVTIIETNNPDLKTKSPRSPSHDYKGNHDHNGPAHRFPLASLTDPTSIDPDQFNDLITAVRYVSDSTLSQPKSEFGAPSSDVLRSNLLDKYTPLSKSFLPNLKNLELFLTTQFSPADGPKDTYHPSNHWLFPQTRDAREWSEIREHVQVLLSDELFGNVENVDFRRVVTKTGTHEMIGWQDMTNSDLMDYLWKNRSASKGKGKGKDVAR